MNDLGTKISSHKPDVDQRPSGRLEVEGAAVARDQIVELDQRRTIGEVLRAHAEVRPEQTAIVASQFALLSYRELQDQIDAARTHLRQAGFGPHARIAIAITNSSEAALAILAVACLAGDLPLYSKLTAPEGEGGLVSLRAHPLPAIPGRAP